MSLTDKGCSQGQIRLFVGLDNLIRPHPITFYKYDQKIAFFRGQQIVNHICVSGLFENGYNGVIHILVIQFS